MPRYRRVPNATLRDLRSLPHVNATPAPAVAQAAVVAEPVVAEPEPAELSADNEPLSYRELQERAMDLGVNAKGSREELEQRIAEATA